GRAILGDVNLDPAPNVATLVGDVVTLPTIPDSYFLGLIVDPNNSILEISELVGGASPRLELVQAVFKTNAAPAESALTDPVPNPANQFPIPASGLVFFPYPTAPVAGIGRPNLDQLLGPG